MKNTTVKYRTLDERILEQNKKEFKEKLLEAYLDELILKAVKDGSKKEVHTAGNGEPALPYSPLSFRRL